VDCRSPYIAKPAVSARFESYRSAAAAAIGARPAFRRLAISGPNNEMRRRSAPRERDGFIDLPASRSPGAQQRGAGCRVHGSRRRRLFDRCRRASRTWQTPIEERPAPRRSWGPGPGNDIAEIAGPRWRVLPVLAWSARKRQERQLIIWRRRRAISGGQMKGRPGRVGADRFAGPPRFVRVLSSTVMAGHLKSVRNRQPSQGEKPAVRNKARPTARPLHRLAGQLGQVGLPASSGSKISVDGLFKSIGTPKAFNANAGLCLKLGQDQRQHSPWIGGSLICRG